MTSARTYSVTRGPDGAWFLLADGWPVCSFLDEAAAREAAEQMQAPALRELAALAGD